MSIIGELIKGHDVYIKSFTLFLKIKIKIVPFETKQMDFDAIMLNKIRN